MTDASYWYVRKWSKGKNPIVENTFNETISKQTWMIACLNQEKNAEYVTTSISLSPQHVRTAMRG